MQRELLKFKNMDIKESKEYRLAKDWEMAVNSFSFNPERFAAAIPDMHPTLQQSLYRLIKACIVSIRFTTYFLEVFENIWDKIWRN